MIGGVRHAALFILLPVSSFFAGVTLTTVNPEMGTLSFLQQSPYFGSYKYFDDTDGVDSSTYGEPIKTDDTTNTTSNTTDILMNGHAVDKAKQPQLLQDETVELIASIKPVAFLFDETAPSSMFLDVEPSTWRKEASFSVKAPSSFSDLFESVVDKAVSDYHGLRSFLRYLNETTVEELMDEAEAAVIQCVEDFFEEVVRLKSLVTTAWEAIPSTIRFWFQVLSAIYQFRSLIRSLARKLFDRATSLIRKLLLKIDARFEIRDRINALMILVGFHVDEYLWNRWGRVMGMDYIEQRFRRMSELDQCANLGNFVNYLACYFATPGDEEEKAHRMIIDILLDFRPSVTNIDDARTVALNLIRTMTPTGIVRFLELVMTTNVAVAAGGTRWSYHFQVLADLVKAIRREEEKRQQERERQQQMWQAVDQRMQEQEQAELDMLRQRQEQQKQEPSNEC